MSNHSDNERENHGGGNENENHGGGNEAGTGMIDDDVAGTESNDFISTGDGDDTLNGGSGHDTLVGGSGSDTFDFGAGDGNDVIADFDITADHIGITLGTNGMMTADDAMSHLGSDWLGNAVLDLGDGNTVTLVGVCVADLSADDFMMGGF